MLITRYLKISINQTICQWKFRMIVLVKMQFCFIFEWKIQTNDPEKWFGAAFDLPENHAPGLTMARH